MLVRQYKAHITIDNDEKPFIIQNAWSPAWKHPYSCDLADPSKEEVKAPGLQICPYDEPKWQKYLESGFIGQSLPSAVIDTMCGRETAWKVIRCVPEKSNLLFVLVNEAILCPDGETLCELPDNCYTESLDLGLKSGSIWVFLSSEYSDGVSITCQREDGRSDEYSITVQRHHFVFMEYSQTGERISRRTEVHFNDDGPDELEITEYL